MRLCTALAALCLLALPRPAAAEYYTWTDEQGRVHFTEDLNQVPARVRESRGLEARESFGGSPAVVLGSEAQRLMDPPDGEERLSAEQEVTGLNPCGGARLRGR